MTTTRYRLPAAFGGLDYPGFLCGCLDTTTVELQIDGKTVHMPLVILTEVTPEIPDQPAAGSVVDAKQNATTSPTAADEPLYLIWSNRHRCWWKPNSAGYTSDSRDAGRYTEADGLMTIKGPPWEPGQPPPEVLIRCPDTATLGLPGAEMTLRSMAKQVSEKFMADRENEEAHRG